MQTRQSQSFASPKKGRVQTGGQTSPAKKSVLNESTTVVRVSEKYVDLSESLVDREHFEALEAEASRQRLIAETV